MRRLFLILVLLPLFIPVRGAPDEVDAGPAIEVAQNWAHQIDAGDYSASYAQGADIFRQRVSAEKWSLILKTIRRPLGTAGARHLLSHNYFPNGYEGTPGEFMAIGFETSFQNTGPYVENIVVTLQDGHWRPAGYVAEPKAALPPQ